MSNEPTTSNSAFSSPDTFVKIDGEEINSGYNGVHRLIEDTSTRQVNEVEPAWVPTTLDEDDSIPSGFDDDEDEEDDDLYDNGENDDDDEDEEDDAE